MVERLCSTYGTALPPPALKGWDTPEQAPEQALYAFPTLEQLAAASEEELRASGFGYRAAFVVGSVAALAAAPGGGAAWLAALRTASFAEVVEALCTLPGVGPKVRPPPVGLQREGPVAVPRLGEAREPPTAAARPCRCSGCPRAPTTHAHCRECRSLPAWPCLL